MREGKVTVLSQRGVDEDAGRYPLPVECLYQLTGPCRTVSDVAGFFGATAYDARLLWASGVVTIIGLFPQR